LILEEFSTNNRFGFVGGLHFIKAKNGREIMIQTKDKKVIHAKGLDSKQLEKVLKEASSITAIDTGKK